MNGPRTIELRTIASRIRALRRGGEEQRQGSSSPGQSTGPSLSGDAGASPAPGSSSDAAELAYIAEHDRPRDYALTDAEVLEKAAQLMTGEENRGIRMALKGRALAVRSSRAQAAQEADPFEAFAAAVRSESEGRTLPWDHLAGLARSRFSPWREALEDSQKSLLDLLRHITDEALRRRITHSISANRRALAQEPKP